jgi:hypothetical protein
MTFKGTVLSLDLATVTGFAWGKPGTVPKFGNKRWMKPGGSRASAYRELRGWLDAFTHNEKIDLIVYESANVQFMAGKTNIDTIKLLIGLAENLEEWCHDHIELREASVSQVRSHFLGQNLKAVVAKPATVSRCHELGWNVTTHDEGDACALWDYQCCHLRPDIAVGSTPLFRSLK